MILVVFYQSANTACHISESDKEALQLLSPGHKHTKEDTEYDNP